MSDLYAGEGTRVTLHFALRLENGEVVDSTFERKPAVFEFGDGNLPEGFESYVRGMRAGERKRVQVPPEKAFGMPNPNNVQTFSRSDFPADVALEKGLVMSFADARHGEVPGVISAVDGDEVVVDFNHPLAGRTLDFEIQVIAVEAVS
ncbi:FKBP-type peptidyl-prolyl cis-trans isomerase [Hahella sp. SMD15-11]|uniref:Peptidyl-prolyl cis-trans isomerase n=1 Tax=Thermohahella caldifontis TaxID=3142973 RepID=A0AB39V123_9GAMM